MSKCTILVSGMIAADYGQGGATWAVLQYVLGFRRLGHRVYFVEPLRTKALRPEGASLEASENVNYFARVCREFDLTGSAALLLEGSRETVGLTYDELHEAAGRADVLLNISGMLADAELIGRIPNRVYLDLDPAFIQLWHEVSQIDMRFDAHTHFVTVGQSLGRPECPAPTGGRNWIGTLPPVVLESWPRVSVAGLGALTTVANWRGYGSIEHEGVLYGQKAHSFRQFFSLPKLSGERFAPAIGIHPAETADVNALAENGWEIVDPSGTVDSPSGYRQFIQQSKAELGIAKSGYVASRCGWFSDRSACYLASGRPVIAQDTGFSRHLPVGEGLFAFASMEDILRNIDAMNADYPCHSRRARSIAEEYLDSDKVLTRLLQKVGAAA